MRRCRNFLPLRIKPGGIFLKKDSRRAQGRKPVLLKFAGMATQVKIFALIVSLAVGLCACQGEPAWAAGTTEHYGGNSSFAGVSSFNGRMGAVTPSYNDYSFSQVSGTVSPSQLSQPLTGISPSSTPLVPSSGNYRIYFNKSDNHWYGLSNSAGTINGPAQLDMPGVINATFQDPVTGVSQTSTPQTPASGDYKFYFNSAAGHWYGISNTSGTVTGPVQIDGGAGQPIVILAYPNLAVNASTTEWIPITGQLGFSGLNNTTQAMVMPVACTMQDLYVSWEGTQSSTGSLAISLYHNGTVTPLAITIAAGAGTGTLSDLAIQWR